MRGLLLVLFLLPCLINAQTAFIYGNDTICDNEKSAQVSVSFVGLPPFTFVYSVNGINQSSISTNVNPYVIKTKISGNYALSSFSDAISAGTISGGAMVMVYNAPTAIINTVSDTIQSLFPFLQFTDVSIGSINLLNWSFGDNTPNQIINNPVQYSTINHEFPINLNVDGIASIYQVSLIITDNNNCMDTTYRNIFVMNDFWIHIPNSFTPDDDQINDKFCIEYNGIRETTFSFYVINRQGEVVFDTNNPSSLRCSTNKGWDGKNNDGSFLIPATYVFEMYFQDHIGWKYTKHGKINLVR